MNSSKLEKNIISGVLPGIFLQTKIETSASNDTINDRDMAYKIKYSKIVAEYEAMKHLLHPKMRMQNATGPSIKRIHK